ncbi:phosphatase 2C-like domain-containing protein [Tricharina praecox]|uniref:phosphatase 2C-like domain-containing protein n=1 Tax=Tricharina praecox TaxID=43433 RepID=UPI002220C7BD|nr:phosphatase 2C-like domain-containing protein [Tricharina praecox]KAI5844246.1 phosphatase 2C-like domain-containing protein [Tricharina praecox]
MRIHVPAQHIRLSRLIPTGGAFRRANSTSSAVTKSAACKSASPATHHFVPSYSLFAKRPPRPFPPPFHSPPASSFSDPLTTSTHNPRIAIERPEGAAFLNGVTNGDDAVLTNANYLAVADGVGAWNTKSHGHAALWSRLMLHYWSRELAAGKYGYRRQDADGGVDPVLCLQEAYQETLLATTSAGARRDQVWQGTTTMCGAVLKGSKLLVLNLGDSVGFVYRPGRRKWALRTKEQWHWFDCPRQLGTNSPDTPVNNCVVQELEVQDGDLVVLATDGLVDNMWDEEILTVIGAVLEATDEVVESETGEKGDCGRMKLVAQRLVEGAKKTAIDPFAESPYMERSIEEGLGIEGGKWDDISVAAAICRPNS